MSEVQAVLERVRLNKPEGVTGLRVDINACNVETRAREAFRSAAGATEQIKGFRLCQTGKSAPDVGRAVRRKFPGGLGVELR